MCPRCAARTLFAAPAQIARSCSSCGLDFASLERGSRAAGLVTILAAALLITVALTIETLFRPPIWLQLVIWAPLTVGAVLGALRGFKTYMLFASYERHSESMGEHEEQAE